MNRHTLSPYFIVSLIAFAPGALLLELAYSLATRELESTAQVGDGLRDIPRECHGNLYDCLNKPET